MYHSPQNILTRLIVCVFLFLATLLHAETITGKCVGVTDGDTATILVDGNRKEKNPFLGNRCPGKQAGFWASSKEKAI